MTTTSSRYEVKVFKLATQERTKYRSIEVIEAASHTTHSLSEEGGVEAVVAHRDDIARFIKDSGKGPDRPVDIDDSVDFEQDRTLEQTAELSCSIVGEMGRVEAIPPLDNMILEAKEEV